MRIRPVVYYLYQTTNLVDGKVYIGKRQYRGADPFGDPYLGSGNVLAHAIAKHGRTNFRKDVLAIVFSADHLKRLERGAVDGEFVARRDTYNLKVGGEGGNGSANRGRKRPDNVLRRAGKPNPLRAALNLGNSYGSANKGRVKAPEWRAKIAASLRGRKQPPRSADHCANLSRALKGKPHARGYKHPARTPEQLERIRAAARRRWGHVESPE